VGCWGFGGGGAGFPPCLGVGGWGWGGDQVLGFGVQTQSSGFRVWGSNPALTTRSPHAPCTSEGWSTMSRGSQPSHLGSHSVATSTLRHPCPHHTRKVDDLQGSRRHARRATLQQTGESVYKAVTRLHTRYSGGARVQGRVGCPATVGLHQSYRKRVSI